MKQRKLIIIGVAGFLLFMFAGIASVGGFLFWGWNMFVNQAKTAINNNPVCRQHLGEIYDIDTDLIATGMEEGEDVFVFRITGSNGSGVVRAEFISEGADEEKITHGTLKLSSGEAYNLIPYHERKVDELRRKIFRP